MIFFQPSLGIPRKDTFLRKERERKKNEKKKALKLRTRPDTRPIPVADGLAGAEMRGFTFSNSITRDGPMDGPTDGQSLL